MKIRIRLGKLRIQPDPDPQPRLATKFPYNCSYLVLNLLTFFLCVRCPVFVWSEPVYIFLRSNQIISDTCSEAWSSRTANSSRPRHPELPLPSFGVSERRHRVFGRRPVAPPRVRPPPLVLRPCWSDLSLRCPPELSAAAGGVVSEQSRRHSTHRRRSEGRRRRGNADLFRRTARRWPVSSGVRASQRSWRPEIKRKPLRSRPGSDVKEKKTILKSPSKVASNCAFMRPCRKVMERIWQT